MKLRRVTSSLKPWQSILAFIIAAAAVFTIGTKIYRYIEKRNHCQVYVNAAEDAFNCDDFDTALERLNSARTYCDDKDIDARYTRVEMFKEAAAYDQVRLVKDPTVLTKINKNLGILRKDLGDTPDLLVLQAVYEELMDRPNTAVDKYYKDALNKRANYANAYNSWGYTIFKWKLGGSGWSDQALEKFKRAAELKQDYGWPHLNKAAVYLELAENALNDKKDLDGATRYLPDAKASLTAAEKLLPTNPRVDLLWGHYYVIQARILKDRNLTSDANDSFSNAKDKLMQSKIKNDQIADTRVLLGSVYLEQGMIDAAVYQLREAVRLDDMNITACARLVFGLSKKQDSHFDGNVSQEIAAEIKRGLGLIDTLRKRFAARSLETPDLDARQWLATAVKTYDELETYLNKAQQDNAVAQAKSKPK